MALRVFYVFLALVAAYAAYNLYSLISLRHEIFDVPAAYTLGPQDADLKVVEFLDYSCPFCQQIHPTITEAVQKDGNVLYIPRPLPSANADSLNAAMIVYAAGKQGKFYPLHNAVLRDFQTFNNERLSSIAPEMGLDLERLQADISDESIKAAIAKNGEIYLRLGGKATPTFMIGEKIIYVPEGSMPTAEDFLRMFAEARGL